MRYSRQYRRRRRSWLAYAAAAGAVLVLAYWAGTVMTRARLPYEPPGEPVGTPAEDAADAAPVDGPVVSAATTFVYVTQYTSTGRIDRQEAAAPPNMWELTREALARLYPQWQVQQFSAQEVVLHRVDHGVDPLTLSEEEARFRTLTVRNGQIVVLAGRPHPEAGVGVSDLRLLQETGVSLEQLMADEEARLRDGIVVEGDEAVARNLEGYMN